jgi:hypothetical protein
MAINTGQRGAVRLKRSKRQRSGSSPVSSADETDNGRRLVRRLPKIKGGELLGVTVLANRKDARRSRRAFSHPETRSRVSHVAI